MYISFNYTKFRAKINTGLLLKVLDIEENVWSPRYGLKGKIDVTGRFKVKNQQTKEEIETIMPVEIKTGKDTHSMEHHVQVILITFGVLGINVGQKLKKALRAMNKYQFSAKEMLKMFFLHF